MHKPTAWLTKNNSSMCHYFTVRDLSHFYGCGYRSSDRVKGLASYVWSDAYIHNLSSEGFSLH